jgi:SAM-dependent methyltransferase
LLALLERECGLRAGSSVADIGSGTGILSEQFLRFGCEVFGVEPNAEMRAAGERLLSSYAGFLSVDGRAEDTGLPGRSINLITAAQSFHWFDREVAAHEFRRILRPGGWVALIWNERLVDTPFLEGYEALLGQYSPDYRSVDHRRLDAAAMDEFFGPGNWQLASMPNQQEFDLEGLLGRLNSSSYAPEPGAAAYEPLQADVTALFENHQRDGMVAFRYRTTVWWGRW